MILLICFLLSPVVVGQNQHGDLREDILKSQADSVPLSPSKSTKPKTTPKAPTLVYLLHADYTIGDEELLPGIQLLQGNVCFKHDNALMYCDSAFFYKEENSLDAYSNVRIVQADTLFTYSDYLFYNGNTRIAELRDNVRMVNKQAVLTTDSLNYDRNTDLAYYYTGGKIVDETNTLTSVWGQYSPSTEIALFKKNVVLTNPNYTMHSDTLRYNTRTKIANIVGQTHIKYQEETDIYSTKGWYNTETERMMLLDRSLVVNNDGKTLTGDTIFYDKLNKFGEGFSKVELTDTVQGTTLYGNYIFYNEETEAGFSTDSALLVYWAEEEKAYIHADTLETMKDSIYDKALAYTNARLYRYDVQGISDTLIYSTRDSIIYLRGLPVLWAEGSQLSGNEIDILTKNNSVDKAHIRTSGMISQKTDSAQYFNQVTGKEIIAHMDSGRLKHVFVNGNAETIYLPLDDSDSTLIGLNKSQSSYVDMYFHNQRIEKVRLTTVSKGTMYPLGQLSGSDLYLRHFFWIEEQRPKSPEDVFTKHINTERVMLGAPQKNDGKSEPPKAAPRADNVPPQMNTRGNTLQTAE